MKKIIKFVLLFSFSITTQNLFWQNLSFNHGLETIVLVAFILTIFDLFLKPIIKLLLLPINFLTLGLIRFVINTLGLYLAVFLIADFFVNPINLPAQTIYSLSLPPLSFSGFWCFLVNSISISFLLSVFKTILKSSRSKQK